MAGMRALGRLFDIGIGFMPVDLNTNNGETGKRINMSTCTGVTVVAIVGVAAGGTDDLVLTFKQHTAYTSGTSNNLAAATVTTSSGITAYWIKTETALDNDEPWVEVTQADSATVTLAGASYAAVQKIIAVDVFADQLGDGYTHLSCDLSVAALGNAELATWFYLPHDLAFQAKPTRLPNLLRPGAANA
jgi:hypothetical protein